MDLVAGMAVYANIATFGTTGSNQNNDSGLPTAVWLHKGDVDSVPTPPTVALVTGKVGVYKVTGTVPTGYSAGDSVGFLFTSTVSGITASIPIEVGVMASATATVTQSYLGQDSRGIGFWSVYYATSPVQSATVNLYLASDYADLGPSATVQFTTTTDSSGNWSIAGVPPGSFALRISANGNLVSEVPAFTVR